jgi:hypothetical protein
MARSNSYGRRRAPRPAGPPRVVGSAAARVEDLRWEERAAELAFNELPDLRSTAERWVMTLGAVMGVFGVVLVIKGPSDITRISDDTVYILVGALLGGAGLCALVAIVMATFAAQGTPHRVERYTGEQVRTFYREEARLAARRLRRSRWSAVVAMVLLGGAIGATWYGTPRSVPDKSGDSLMTHQMHGKAWSPWESALRL